MCGGYPLFGSFPNSLGYTISQLKPGDEVIITLAEGDSPVCTIIAAVDGYSALSVDGHAISCGAHELVVTGNHFDTYIISPQAQAILDSIAQRLAWEDEDTSSIEPSDLDLI